MFISSMEISNVRPSCFFRVPKGSKHARGYPWDSRGGPVWIAVNWWKRSWVRVLTMGLTDGWRPGENKAVYYKKKQFTTVYVLNLKHSSINY